MLKYTAMLAGASASTTSWDSNWNMPANNWAQALPAMTTDWASVSAPAVTSASQWSTSSSWTPTTAVSSSWTPQTTVSSSSWTPKTSHQHTSQTHHHTPKTSTASWTPTVSSSSWTAPAASTASSWETWEAPSDYEIPTDIMSKIEARNMYSDNKWQKASSAAMYTAENNWESALAKAAISMPTGITWASEWVDTPVTLPATTAATPVTLPATVAPPKACCMAYTAECLACSEGLTVSQYCMKYSANPECAKTTLPATMPATTQPAVSTKPAPAYVDVITTASGLRVREARGGNGQKPKKSDKVKVHYRGFFPDSGEEFDSSYKNGKPAEFDVANLIPGVTEALQLMEVGGKYEIIVPSSLAYGAAGIPGTIPANADLAFVYELIEIMPSAKQQVTYQQYAQPSRTSTSSLGAMSSFGSPSRSAFGTNSFSTLGSNSFSTLGSNSFGSLGSSSFAGSLGSSSFAGSLGRMGYTGGRTTFG